MMFQPEHIDLIRAGEKTQTRRDWKPNYAGPSVGSVVMATPTTLGPIVGHADCDCYIRITRRWTEPLGAIATRSADAEGGYTVQGFKHLWEDINGEFDPELEVEVLEFEYVGYERPDSEFQTTIADGGHLPSDPGPEAYPDPEDDPFACSICGAPLGESKRIRGEEHCDMCQREYGPDEYLDVEGRR